MWQNNFKILKWWKWKTDSESIYLAVFVLWVWINMKELKLSALSALSLLPYKITDDWATYIKTKLECRLPSNNKFLIYNGKYENVVFIIQNPRNRNKCFQKQLSNPKNKKKYYEILTIYECVEKSSMIIGCNICMIFWN